MSAYALPPCAASATAGHRDLLRVSPCQLLPKVLPPPDAAARPSATGDLAPSRTLAERQCPRCSHRKYAALRAHRERRLLARKLARRSRRRFAPEADKLPNKPRTQ